MTPEAKVKAAVKKMLDKHGVYYFYAATHGFGRSGVPDLVCCHNGHFLAIECKAGNWKPGIHNEREAAQVAWAALVNSLGGWATINNTGVL